MTPPGKEIPAEVLLISERIGALLSENPPERASEMVLHAVRVAALRYSARYLRSIMADKAANLLDDWVLELDRERDADLEDDDNGWDGQTIIGLGVRRVPSATPIWK